LPTDTWNTEAERVEAWKFERLLAFGFNGEQAVVMLAANVDLHAIETMLNNGCTLALAFDIVI
jgi:hypothetical protein